MAYQSGLPAYDDARRFPPRVWTAVELTRSRRFAKACTPEVGRLLQLCASLGGGLVVLDDYTPGHPDKEDPARDIWLDNVLYRAQELMVAPDASVILAVRL